MQTEPKPMKMKPARSASRRGFTQPELVMVLATLALLAGIVVPGLASSKIRGEQAMCFNNLRRIGQAFHLWANDHEDRNPWLTPANAGGTYFVANPLKANAYFQMGMVSNELATPQVLICPSDRGVGAPRRMASDFSYTNEGGFFVPGFRNAALSYIIGLHSFPGASRAILSGDRNIRWDALDDPCSAGIDSCARIWGRSDPVSTAAWTNAIHGETGNFLFNDGRVAEISNVGFRQATKSAQDNIAVGHFLVPN